MPQIRRDLDQINVLPKERKVMLGGFLSLLFLLGFLVGVVYVQNSARLTDIELPIPFVSPAPKLKSTLTLSPSTKTLRVGEVFPVSVSIAQDPVQAVDVVLTYDPSVFHASNIVRSDLFPLFLRERIEPGKVIVSSSVTPERPAATGSGEIFRVSFTALKATEKAMISFDKKQTITARNGKNTLSETVEGTYSVTK